jgi:hypothetical protein
MTWRAFLIGLVLSIAMCWKDAYGGLTRAWGWTTEGHFPEAVVFLLVLLVLVVNVAIKLVKRTAGLKQAELMLIWCMLLVAAVLPTTGLMRFWLPMLGGPPYFAGRSDIAWRDTSLQDAPSALLLSKDPKSLAARQFYEGMGEERRVPWALWLVPMASWGVLLALFYLAVIFMCAVLRKQWVDKEHLLFALARIPMDFTEGSGENRLFPAIFYGRAFQVGFIGAVVFRLLRALPVFFGATQPWNIQIPLGDVLRETPLRDMSMANSDLWWDVIGLAYLLPADVSLSVWFFYLFGRAELQTSAWMGSTLQYGGTWSQLMTWQQAGAYMAFTVGALYMTRRHLADVVRKAVGLGKDVDDSAEPVSYRLAAWGLLITSIGAIGWAVWFGMGKWTALALFTILMLAQLVHARLVAQSGLYQTWLIWNPPDVLHALSGGHAFNAAGAVVAYMQRAIIMNNVSLAPAAIHVFRIGEVFKKGRRLLLPIMALSLLVAVTVCSWTFLTEGYLRGVLSFGGRWGNIGAPQDAFESAHLVSRRPYETAQPKWTPFGLGVILTGFVMFMRARFYWWPIHPIGLLTISNWSADRMWLPFFLGWLIKVSLMKFGSGKLIRQARTFVIGMVMAYLAMSEVSSLVRALSGATIARF